MNESDIYKPENLEGARNELSEDGKYSLVIETYRVGKPEDHYWSYTRGILRDAKSGEILLTIDRDYPDFWYLFLTHPNGNDYFLAGREYHGGYSIFDLTNRIEHYYSARKSHICNDKRCYHQFFCWANVKFDPIIQCLFVEGCYWGDSFQQVKFDFSDPSKLPLPELERAYIIDITEDGDSRF